MPASGVINRGAFGKALWPGINAWYGYSYNEHQPEWVHIFSFNSSGKAFEEDVGTSGLGLASVKPEGEAVAYDSMSQAYITRYTMVTYGLGFIITDEMIEAYSSLHADGWAHSIEVWIGDELVGGLYGLAIGKAFFGESMFSQASDASKVAMWSLCTMLVQRQFEILDCQVVSPHLTSLGAILTPRREFGALLKRACEPASRTVDWPDNRLPVAEILAYDSDFALQ